MSACNRYHLLLNGSTRSDPARRRMTKYGDIFKWLRFQRSTFNAAHYNTHWHGLIRIYDTQRHIIRSLRIQMSAPYTTPNSGTFLASAGVPTGASHDTTRRFSLSPPASCSETGAQRHAGSARTGAHARPPRAAPPRPAQAWSPPAGGMIARRHTRRETYVSRTACRGDRLGGIVFCARRVWYGMVLCYEVHAPVR